MILLILSPLCGQMAAIANTIKGSEVAGSRGYFLTGMGLDSDPAEHIPHPTRIFTQLIVNQSIPLQRIPIPIDTRLTNIRLNRYNPSIPTPPSPLNQYPSNRCPPN